MTVTKETGLIEDLEKRGPSIQVASGHYFHILDPTPEEVNIEDIATALSKVCRFTGHVKKFYSVAQHSVLCSWLVPDEYKLAALMHDAAEAYIGDIAKPLKVAIGMEAPGILEYIEERIECVIAEKYGYVFPYHPSVKEADNLALVTEARDLMPDTDREWSGPLPDPLPEPIVPWPSLLAASYFLGRFNQLTNPNYYEL